MGGRGIQTFEKGVERRLVARPPLPSKRIALIVPQTILFNDVGKSSLRGEAAGMLMAVTLSIVAAVSENEQGAKETKRVISRHQLFV